MQAFSGCAVRLSIIGCKHSEIFPLPIVGASDPFCLAASGRLPTARIRDARGVDLVVGAKRRDAVDPGRHLSTRGTVRPSTRGGSGARHGSNSAPRRSRVLSGNSGLDDSNSPNTGIIEFAIRPERRSVRRAAQSFKTPPALPIVPTSRVDLGIAQLLDDLAHANSYSTRTVHSEAL